MVFILRSIFGSKAGWTGAGLILFQVVWRVLDIWQIADFLPRRMTPLADFLNSLLGVLTLVGLGFLFMYRAVSVRWAQSQQSAAQDRGTSTSHSATPDLLQPAGRQTINEDLRQRCCKLSTEIFEFYKRQRENLIERLQSDYVSSLYNDPAREQKRAELIELHNTWMVDRYGEQFGGRVLKLSDDLANHNCITPEDRKRFENPTKPQDIQYIAQRLGAICNRSDSDPQERSAQQDSATPEANIGHVDNRSVTSHNQMGGQTAFNITNEGPQPRRISPASRDALVRELQKYPPEKFQLSSMADAESGELGAVLRDLLRQGGWQSGMEVSGAMTNHIPRGVLIETDLDSAGVDVLVQWMRQVRLNPEVNRGEQRRFNILMGELGDSPPAPVHIVVGVLPQ